MCNHYRAPRVEHIRALFGDRARSGPLASYSVAGVGPWQLAPFIRKGGLIVGQWGLIPWFAKTRRPSGRAERPISTNNCRVETAATAPAFKSAWARQQRCLIPALDYDEPNWSTGRNVWWRLSRADGEPWALAGLWSQWTDPASGEVVESFTMLTQNCDAHPILSLLHKPDPALPGHAQDKRAVVPIERANWDTWLEGTAEEALTLIRVPSGDLLVHGAAEPGAQVPLASAIACASERQQSLF
jgi:putative SOS response-associated peptidase YedK